MTRTEIIFRLRSLINQPEFSLSQDRLDYLDNLQGSDQEIAMLRIAANELGRSDNADQTLINGLRSRADDLETVYRKSPLIMKDLENKNPDSFSKAFYFCGQCCDTGWICNYNRRRHPCTACAKGKEKYKNSLPAIGPLPKVTSKTHTPATEQVPTLPPVRGRRFRQ